jgi:hypothetical protein
MRMQVCLAEETGAISGLLDGVHPIRALWVQGMSIGLVLPDSGLVRVQPRCQTKAGWDAFRRVADDVVKEEPVARKLIQIRCLRPTVHDPERICPQLVGHEEENVGLRWHQRAGENSEPGES